MGGDHVCMYDCMFYTMSLVEKRWHMITLCTLSPRDLSTCHHSSNHNETIFSSNHNEKIFLVYVDLHNGLVQTSLLVSSSDCYLDLLQTDLQIYKYWDGNAVYFGIVVRWKKRTSFTLTETSLYVVPQPLSLKGYQSVCNHMYFTV